MSFTSDLVSDLGAKLAAGDRLSETEIKTLARSVDLLSLGMLADGVRTRRHGDRVTFVRVAQVAVAPTVPADLIVPSQAKEIRLTGTPGSLDEAVRCVRAVVAVADHRPVTGFALNDLDTLCTGNARVLAGALAQLRSAGLAMLSDVIVEQTNGPERLFQAAAEAGLGIARASIRRSAPAAALGLIRNVARWGPLGASVKAFAPVPRETDSAAPSTGYDDVRQVALARILVGDIESIQMDWALHGPKLAQVGLTFGADDLDSVSPIDTLDLGPRRTAIEEVRRNIRAVGLVPVERDGRFVVLGS